MVAEEAVAERARIGNSWRAERAFRKRMQQEDLENAIITEILQEAAQVSEEIEEPNARAPPEPLNLQRNVQEMRTERRPRYASTLPENE